MILFRDPLCRGGTRIPPWLEGCPDVQRLLTQDGDVLSTVDPLFLSVPPNAAWHSVGDGWQMCLHGDPQLDRHRRHRNDIEMVELVDCFGRLWHAPMILNREGQCLLPMAWGRENGMRVRKPSSQQDKLITAATGGRQEIENNTIGQVPIDIVSEWVNALLESVYHLNGETIEACGLMTDELALSILLVASGYPRV